MLIDGKTIKMHSLSPTTKPNQTNANKLIKY